MLLSDIDIEEELSAGRLVVNPLDRSLIQPASIDVRLDSKFLVFDCHRYSSIDPAEPQKDLTRPVTVKDGPFILHPGEFVLASTREFFDIPTHLAARLEGKSSLGRLGLVTHSTAGFIDPGFSGHVTLELSNSSGLPMKLWPGMKVGQLCLFRLTQEPRIPYGLSGSHYQGQVGVTASRSYERFTSDSHPEPGNADL